MAICQGATAIGYFTHVWKPSYHQFGVPEENRKALRRIMIAQLFDHERIRTTLAKADAIRGDAEHMITLAKRGNKAGDAQMVHARRLVAAAPG